VSATVRDRVLAAVAGIAGFGTATAARRVAVRPGKETWRVDGNGRAAAVSVPTGDPPPAATTARIARALAVAAPAGVAPASLAVDPDAGIVVVEWIEGGTWTPRDLLRSERRVALAQVLRTLHGLRADLDPVDLAVSASTYRNRIERAGAGAGAVERRALDELIDRAAAFGATREAAALVHGDVTAGNVVGGPSPVLVDWEYAGTGDPRLDLATVTALHDLDEARRAAFLSAYGARGARGVDVVALAEAERLVVLLAWAWALAERLDRPDDPRALAWERRMSVRLARGA